MRPDPDLLRQAKRRLNEAAAAAFELIELAGTPSVADWFELFETGEILTTGQAGFIAELSPEQIRKRCVESDQEGRPIGKRTAGSWLVSKRRLLADIEERDDPHARVRAESRVKKLHEMWASPPSITEID